MPIPLVNLNQQQIRIKEKIQARIEKVLSHGQYILGPEVSELEQRLGGFCGANHVVTCANGTDALTLALMAEDIGPGDAVFVPSFTFVATAEAPAQMGAHPIFVDVDLESFSICPNSLKMAIDEAKKMGLQPRAIIAVDLFGRPAKYDELREISIEEDLTLIADAAQSFGACYRSQYVGTLADYTTTSFFPAKPLGCYGDGGAIFTQSPDKAELLKSLRFHGKGNYKYENIRIGLNSRLDTIQAAILLEKLEIFPEELKKRSALAKSYDEKLSTYVKTPLLKEHETSSWALYTILLDRRDELQNELEKKQISSVVYYPKPLHSQKGYKQYTNKKISLENSELIAQRVLSLPMHPYLTSDDQEHVIKTIAEFCS